MSGVAEAQHRADWINPGPPASGWPGVASVAAGTLLLVTTGFLPIGPLSPIAADLGVSEGVAGLSVAAPGFVAAVAAPVLTIRARNADRKTVVLDLIGTLAPNFAVFLVGRVVLGLAVGGLWSFAVAVGRRLAPEGAGARATSVISLGISAGTVFGTPVGAVAGGCAGWRMAFAADAPLGLVVQLAFAQVRMARTGFVAGGHLIAYTFLEPDLRDALRIGQDGVALALAGHAVAGVVGLFAGERFAVRDVRSAFRIALSAGAAVGGLLVDTSGIGWAFLAGGAVCNAGAVVPMAFRARTAATLSTPAAQGDAR